MAARKDTHTQECPLLCHIPDKLDVVKVCDPSTFPVITLHFQVKTSLQLEDIKMVTDLVVSFAESREAPFVLWIEHVGEGDLQFPDIMGVLHIAGRLIEHKELIKESLVCTCIQAKTLADVLVTAKDLFLNIYHPVAPFEVKVGREASRSFMDHHVRKRASA